MKKGDNFLGFITSLLTLKTLQKKESIMFALHDPYDLGGRPSDSTHNMFHPIIELKRDYNHIDSSKVFISFQHEAKAKPESKREKEHQREDVSIDVSDQHHNVPDVDPPKSPGLMNVFPGLHSKSIRSVSFFNTLAVDIVNVDNSKKKLEFALGIMNKKTGQQIEKIASLGNAVYKQDFLDIAKQYQIHDGQLLRTLSNALRQTNSLRVAVLKNLKDIPISELSSTAESKMLFPLRDHFRVTLFKNIKKYPVDTVQRYFGEKIALYFSFLNFFKDRLLTISGIGLVMMVVVMAFMVYAPTVSKEHQDDDTYLQVYAVLQIIFLIYVVFWIKRFGMKWKEYEQQFSISFGEEKITRESPETIRPSFKGIWRRNIENDKVNSFEVNGLQKKRKLFLLVSFFLIMAGGGGVVSYIILSFKRTASEEKWIPTPFKKEDYGGDTAEEYSDKLGQAYIEPNELLFNLIEVIRIIIFQYIYKFFITKLVTLQNLKYKRDHERVLVFFCSIYQLLNNSYVMIIVAWQCLFADYVYERQSSGNIELVVETVCIDSDCNTEVANFLLHYLILQLLLVMFNLFKAFVVVALANYIARKSKKILDSVLRSMETRRNKTQTFIKHNNLDIENKLTMGQKASRIIEMFYRSGPMSGKIKLEEKKIKGKNDESEEENMLNNETVNLYQLVDMEINRQVGLEGENAEMDADPLLDDYLELFNSLGNAALFGVIFPLSFPIALLTCLLQHVQDKHRILNDAKRPVPQSSSSIGLWNDILSLISLLSIVTNTFFASFILLEDMNVWVKLLVFVVLNIGLFILTFIYEKNREVYTDPSLKILLNRADFIEAKLFNIFTKPKKKKDKLQLTFSSKIFNEVETKKRVTNLNEFINNEEEDIRKKNEEDQKRILEGFKPGYRQFSTHKEQNQEIFNTKLDMRPYGIQTLQTEILSPPKPGRGIDVNIDSTPEKAREQGLLGHEQDIAPFTPKFLFQANPLPELPDEHSP